MRVIRFDQTDLIEDKLEEFKELKAKLHRGPKIEPMKEAPGQ